MNAVENNDTKQNKSFLRDGSFGSIYKGRWDDQDIIIKEPNPKEPLSQSQLENEMHLYQGLSHPNIVQLLHCQYDQKNMFLRFIVLEFMCEGDLFDLINKNELSLEWQISILEQVTQALNYLHNDQRIIHRDLKPENVLIKKDGTGFQAKLCDFGVAIKLPKNKNSFRDNDLVGTYQYLAPEIITSKSCTYSFQSDIYALSMIAYALLTGKIPFSELDALDDTHYELTIKMAIRRGKRPKIPESCLKEFKNFVVQCWQNYPNRPSVENLLTNNLFNLNKPDSHAQVSKEITTPLTDNELQKLSPSNDGSDTIKISTNTNRMWQRPKVNKNETPAHRNDCIIL